MNAHARTRRVLLVEDDPLVRMAAVDMLEMAGHEVHEAVSAEAALKELGGAQFDVLITDLKLPGMTGEDLVLEVLRQWPKLKVIVMSGKGAERLAAVQAQITLLPKPFQWEQLVKIVSA